MEMGGDHVMVGVPGYAEGACALGRNLAVTQERDPLGERGAGW